ncbi:MAG: hypothetical protein QOJ95_2005 [Mycobacterium sp.]|jgi:hypothetical protein|nr:hypothetical protein [Mycobacterium sp.]
MSQLIDAEERELVPAELWAEPVEDGGRPERPRPGDSHGGQVAVLCCLTVLAVVLYLVNLNGVDLNALTGVGLISVLPVSTLAGLGLLVIAFVASVSLRRPCVWLLGSQLVLLVLLLHGITALLESEPRFAINFVHAGFVEFIDRTGTTVPALDCRWSWPGFFGLAAFWIGSGHLDALHNILIATPAVSNLLYLGVLALLMSTLRMSWQAKWLAALFFCLLNWVGQDYFSPQGWTLLLYLMFLAFLITWFRQDGVPGHVPRILHRTSRLWRWLWRNASPGELPARSIGPAERIVIVGVVVGLFATATVSHQLTPFAMMASAAGLVVARRCTLSGLPVLLGVLLLAFISYMTQAYWGGHFGAVMSGVGDVGGTMSSTVAARASLGSPEHQFVVHARMATTVLVFLIAGWGLYRRRRQGIEDRVLMVLTAAPIGLAAMQSYGGEMALRVYLFALAPASVLAALAVFPRPEGRPSILARCIACVSALVMLFSFLVTRYGNEAFERIPTGAVSAVSTVYDHTNGNVRFLYVTAVPELDSTPFMPLGYRDVERISWTNTMAPPDPANVSGVLRTLREQGPGSFLITTRSQEAFVVYGQGYPKDWGDRFRHALEATPEVRVVVQNPDASVYAVDPAPGTVAKPFVPPPTGMQVWRTPWTPVGVPILVMLMGVLGVREARRVGRRRGERRRLRPLTIAAVPLLIGFALVVVERFALLTS